MKLIVECPEELVDRETISLAVNLACDARSAQLMCRGPGLNLLVRRALQTQDSLLLKVMRNVSQHPGPTRKLFLVRGEGRRVSTICGSPPRSPPTDN